MAGAVAMTPRAGEPEAPSDLELVRLAQAGDTQAFGTLVERNRRAVFRAALAAVGSPAEADDVAQDAFLAAYRKLSHFRGDAAFRTWVVSIAWRKALDRRKSVARWVKMTVTPQRFDDQAGDGMDELRSGWRSPEEHLASAELERTIRRLIATLPRKLRDALLLSGSDEYSYEQIAVILGIPVGTVKWRVSEARRLLKQKLASTGHTR
ncbi:MAG TPA: RNA polymerase sigma factor [Vicinamibacterales bacterium]|nr:RNA polymerase sigma factor [Vicinamibacterales bacterium]